MKKKSFTLVEILVSISIFSIVVLFLYKTLDTSEKSNLFFKSKLENIQDINDIKRVFFSDFIHQTSKERQLLKHKDNYIITFESTNIYHNPFYQNITYLVSREKNLFRIESKDKFDIKKINDDFFKNSYIDIVDNNVTKFTASKQKDNSIVIYILKENKENIIFRF